MILGKLDSAVSWIISYLIKIELNSNVVMIQIQIESIN